MILHTNLTSVTVPGAPKSTPITALQAFTDDLTANDDTEIEHNIY